MRELIGSFDRQFADLHSRSCELTLKTGNEMLYARTNESPRAIGELVIRSAASVEQMIGGITTRLWDDPFEWTLPERMPRMEDVIEYLNEVERTRQRGFTFFKNDDELILTLPAPVEMKTLHRILLESLAAAERLYGQAMALHQLVKPQE
jgi:hypothetical protein